MNCAQANGSIGDINARYNTKMGRIYDTNVI